MTNIVQNQIDTPRLAALAVVGFCAAMLLPIALSAAVDERTLNGINVWIKPLKMLSSFALHWLTLACLLRCLTESARTTSSLSKIFVAGAFATITEGLYLVFQASRGRASHFNLETTWECLVYYAVMAPSAVVIMLTTAWLGWTIWKQGDSDCGIGLRLGAALGLILSGVLTVLIGGLLGSGFVDGPGHWVGGERTDASGLPIFGWSTTGGDLRVPHFFATHLVQALPLLGWIADRWANPHWVRHCVWAGAGLGVAVALFTLVQAICGKPFLA